MTTRPEDVNADEHAARLVKATKLADVIDASAVLDDPATLRDSLLRMSVQWWLELCRVAHVNDRKAPSMTTRNMVASLLLGRLEARQIVDPFEGLPMPAAASVSFVGCDR